MLSPSPPLPQPRPPTLLSPPSPPPALLPPPVSVAFKCCEGEIRGEE